MSLLTECPSCGATSVRSSIRREEFRYGAGGDTVLFADVPVGVCSACGFEYTDARAEKARHAAVCSHLGVFSPEEIVSIREKYGLSQAEFSEITKIGEASLSRWERGNKIQNAAYDQLLYLLTYSENLLRLKSRRFVKQISGSHQPVFRVLRPTQTTALEAGAFQLRPTGT